MAAAQVHCKVCNVTTTPKRFGHTLAGLRTYTCPACLTPHTFSLGPLTKLVYIVFGVVLFAGALRGIEIAGYLILLVGYAFHQDRKLKTSPARAEVLELGAAPAAADERTASDGPAMLGEPGAPQAGMPAAPGPAPESAGDAAPRAGPP